MLAGLWRTLRGPTDGDRLLAPQLFGTTGVALLLVLADGLGAPSLRDVALVLALLAVLTTSAFALRLEAHVTASDWLALPFLAGSAFFFLSGTVGLLRFPDLYTRLHALTKADNPGLGLAVAGLAIRDGTLAVALKLVLAWLLAMLASSTSCHLLARAARAREGGRP